MDPGERQRFDATEDLPVKPEIRRSASLKFSILPATAAVYWEASLARLFEN